MADFAKNFEEKKAEFQNLFGFAWNKQPELYLQYLQSWYMAEMLEKLDNNFSNFTIQQEETRKLRDNFQLKSY